MNFVPCLTWVEKGIAKSCPDKLQLTPEELKNIIQETKKLSDEIENDELSDEENSNDETSNAVEESENSNKDEDDFDTRYNLNTYDDDGEDQPFMNISDVATFVDNKDDNYITDYDAVEEDDKEDEEDFIIKDNDNLLLVSHIEEESSVLEVYVYNKEEDSMYVHHDIVLPAYPLALEWLDFHPSDETPGNYVAVGDMTSVIKIWDLDVVDILEPDYCLGKNIKKSKMEKMKLKYHTDAVLSLSWNKHIKHVLASGSADSSIIIWDLQTAKPVKKLGYHTDKVQALQYHPFESPFLLSGCTDGVIKLYDCRSSNVECKSWKVEGEIERVTWNLLEPMKFICSTDLGFVHSVDIKAEKIEHSVKAHSDAVTGLDICPTKPNILVTASMDQTIKIWDLEKLSHVRTQKMKVGSIYTAKFAPDSELTLAIGGNNRSNCLKVLDLAEKLDGASCDKDKCDNVSNLQTEMTNMSKAKGMKNKQLHQKKEGQFFKNIDKSKTSLSVATSESSTSCSETAQNTWKNAKRKAKRFKNNPDSSVASESPKFHKKKPKLKQLKNEK